MNPLLALYSSLPEDHCILFIRHGERPEITDAASSDTTLLTANGIDRAIRLGASDLAPAPPGYLFHSPVPRCGQTTEAILKGLERQGIQADNQGPLEGLFPPFTPDHVNAFMTERNQTDYASEAFVRAWLAGELDPLRYPDPHRAAKAQLDFLLEKRRTLPGRHLHISHDCNILLLAWAFMGLMPEASHWPGFLEGMLLVVNGETVTFHYRNHPGAKRSIRTVPPPSPGG